MRTTTMYRRTCITEKFRNDGSWLLVFSAATSVPINTFCSNSSCPSLIIIQRKSAAAFKCSAGFEWGALERQTAEQSWWKVAKQGKLIFHSLQLGEDVEPCRTRKVCYRVSTVKDAKVPPFLSQCKSCSKCDAVEKYCMLMCSWNDMPPV